MHRFHFRTSGVCVPLALSVAGCAISGKTALRRLSRDRMHRFYFRTSGIYTNPALSVARMQSWCSPAWGGACYGAWDGFIFSRYSVENQWPVPWAYDGEDDLAYLACLEILPWEQFDGVSSSIVLNNLEWTLSTSVNTLPTCESSYHMQLAAGKPAEGTGPQGRVCCGSAGLPWQDASFMDHVWA